MLETAAALLLAALHAASPVPATSVAVVERLYADFPWNGASITGQAPAVLSRYFDPELTALLVADRQCSERSGEICNLDFDPIYFAQDAEIAGLQASASADGRQVTVQFRNHGEMQKLQYDMVPSSEGWRIHDIRYEGQDSLATLLAQPIAAE